MGTMPVRECSLRQKKELSLAGAERLHSAERAVRQGGAGGAAVAMKGSFGSVMECTGDWNYVQQRDYSAVVLPASRKVACFVRLSLCLCEITAIGSSRPWPVRSRSAAKARPRWLRESLVCGVELGHGLVVFGEKEEGVVAEALVPRGVVRISPSTVPLPIARTCRRGLRRGRSGSGPGVDLVGLLSKARSRQRLLRSSM